VVSLCGDAINYPQLQNAFSPLKAFAQGFKYRDTLQKPTNFNN